MLCDWCFVVSRHKIKRLQNASLISSRALVQVQTATRKQTRIKHVLVPMASSLTFWEQCTEAGISPGSEPTESARLALLCLPSLNVPDNFSYSFYLTTHFVLTFLSFPFFHVIHLIFSLLLLLISLAFVF
jgi:hypothetical protein